MKRQSVPSPAERCLRVFAVDPAAASLGVPNEVTLRIAWEDGLQPGPRGEYVEVVDIDARGERVHPPLDLDRADVLAAGGLVPSDGDPAFRQQMAFAVAMRTIESFERALGRPAQWAPRADGDFRRRLAIHPHYDEVLNAWYERKTGVCLGYGSADGALVLTCLSQDAIARAVTEALLDGLNVELGAELSRAFADLVALLQHFGEGAVLAHEIAAVRGDLRGRSLLGAIAPQLAAALGRPDGVWRPRGRPGERSDSAVAAVFLAFTRIYDARVADLRRIASRGTGVLTEGALHPDVVRRLAREASVVAAQVLNMCIRALDYLPPVGADFGDFLRAVVTADRDAVPLDERRYRTAFADAFRAYGIAPAPGGTVSAETLLWPRAAEGAAPAVASFVQHLGARISYWTLPPDRDALWEHEREWRQELAEALDGGGRLGPVSLDEAFEVVTVNLRERSGPAGEVQLMWVVKLAQGDAGCTLLIDADSGAVRYRIDKAPPRRAASLLRLADAGPPSAARRRALRVFAFDPTAGAELSTAGINEVTLELPYEPLAPGPAGEYVEVVDHDPASACFYEPVDLEDRRIVATDGLAPSESNPQFHQQMAYAVTMRVIRDFEQALGRRTLWAPRWADGGEHYVGRLRIHPHALREANAYYSPGKKALLFGYFSAAGDGARQLVFTALSHDIVAHEVTHALLDGMHRRFREATNPDVLAFHEAFADIVALFEHFSLPDVLRHQIAATRGDLASQNRLGELAQQFGMATGRRAALRSAIGRVNPETGEWEPLRPDPEAYRREREPHARGSILVAAVFDAFLTLYKASVADLLRIATEGTGVLPAGQLHPDLVARLADEAAAAARRVLAMCIRALDYCPPVDVTFGDYLRALVTADFELDPVDAGHRRVAFAEAFRRYGIVPDDVRTLSVDGLLWRPTSAAPDEDEDIVVGHVRRWAVDIASWGPARARADLFALMAKRRAGLHEYLLRKMQDPSAVLSGLDVTRPFEVHSIRPGLGRDRLGRPRFNWIVEVTQQFPDALGAEITPPFRTGSTLVIDAATGRVRYSIRKPFDPARVERQRAYFDDDTSLAAVYFGAREPEEPFAMLHRLA